MLGLSLRRQCCNPSHCGRCSVPQLMLQSLIPDPPIRDLPYPVTSLSCPARLVPQCPVLSRPAPPRPLLSRRLPSLPRSARSRPNGA